MYVNIFYQIPELTDLSELSEGSNHPVIARDLVISNLRTKNANLESELKLKVWIFSSFSECCSYIDQRYSFTQLGNTLVHIFVIYINLRAKL